MTLFVLWRLVAVALVRKPVLVAPVVAVAGSLVGLSQ
jgi:hypothetical protein